MALTHFTDAEVQSGGLDVLTEQILEVRSLAVIVRYCWATGQGARW